MDTEIARVETTAQGLRSHCYFCGGAWGACTCTFPDQAQLIDEGKIQSLDDLPGFDFGGDYWVTDPATSVCGRFYVDPVIYYGDELVRAAPGLAATWRTMAGDPSSIDRLLARAGGGS